jgi:HAMP domain-containing protein
VANPYSIHLVEPLSLEVAQRVANETASQLGGTPDKLAQLLTRNSGSRIARASSAAQADRVASILRKAGVAVQVVDPETIETMIPTQNSEPANSSTTDTKMVESSSVVDSAKLPEPFENHQINIDTSVAGTPLNNNYDVNAGSSNNASGGIPIVPDEIIPIDDLPYKPLTTKNPTPLPDPFPAVNSSMTPGIDPFATDNKDLFSPESSPFDRSTSNGSFQSAANNSFGPPTDDPFAAPANVSLNAPVNDPFAAPSNNPFAETTAPNDPFAPPKNDPFTAPQSDPFATPNARDPFAPAAGTSNAMPETPSAFDPFAQVQTKLAASDLPPQALKAQNRSTRRTSIRGQMLSGLILPVLLVGLLTGLYLNYQIPITMQRFLTSRAKATSSVLANRLIAELSNTEGITQKALLDKLTTETRISVPDALFVAVSTVANNNKVVSNSVDAEQDIAKINETLDRQSASMTNGEVVDVGGKGYIAYAVPIRTAIGKPLGTVISGIDYNVINTEKLNLFIPLFIALTLIILAASVIAAILANRLLRPITAAAEQANRISLGDLDRTVEVQSNDEIGDLLGSLERMRISLKSVIGRLRRDR